MPATTTVAPFPLRPAVGAAEPTELLDEHEVHALRCGEAWAWERAYLLYARRLTGYLFVQLGSREDAAEALSDTFLKALKGCNGMWGGPKELPAWLFRIARNVARDRQRARRHLTGTWSEIDPPDLSSGPEGVAILHDEASRVRTALEALEPEDREIVVLRVCGGLSSQEVGRILGKRPGAIRMRQHRALQTLAGRMGGS